MFEKMKDRFNEKHYKYGAVASYSKDYTDRVMDLLSKETCKVLSPNDFMYKVVRKIMKVPFPWALNSFIVYKTSCRTEMFRIHDEVCALDGLNFASEYVSRPV